MLELLHCYQGGLSISQNSVTRLSWNLASMAFGLSSALLVIGCGGPEYRPSASTEASQSQKPAAAPAKSNKPIEIATGGQQAAAERACGEAIAAATATAAARATGSRPAATQSNTPAIALVGTSQDGAAGSAKTGAVVPRSSSSATIICNGKTYPPTPSVQQTEQPRQTNTPVVQMPQN